jgi:hypothetical protein
LSDLDVGDKGGLFLVTEQSKTHNWCDISSQAITVHLIQGEDNKLFRAAD